MAAFWIIVAGVALLIEAITTGLTSIWFTIGGFVAAVAAWLGAGLPVQIILFLVVSIALMLLVRPLAKKKVTGEVVPTNADSLIGRKLVVIEEVNNREKTGKAKVGDIDWTLRSLNGTVIPKDSIVVVKEIEGTKLQVVSEAEAEAM
ncbi:MAG: NfeD family protein [Eubacterium sp.]|nr:NfeD family protein [Eubacterium sp.]